MSATKAAVEEGIIPGGGAALVHAAAALADGLRAHRRRGDRRRDRAQGAARAAVLDRRERRPGGCGRGQQGRRAAGCGQGFNAATLTYGDLVADGVVDPVKVTRSAVLNAASIARMVLTTESAVVDKPEPPAPAPAAGHGHGHGH